MHSYEFVADNGFSVRNASGVETPVINPNGSLANTSLIQYATVSVSSAEILALFTTAKQLVPAPAAGQVIEFISGTVSYVKVNTAYTVGSSTNLSVKYKDKTGADVSSTRATTGFIDQSTSQYYMLRPLAATLALDANAVAQPLCLALLVANPTTGDGTFTVNIAYRIVTL
jgi:hypothetical protein